MCGIFGIIVSESINEKDIKQLAKLSKRRGQDASGVVYEKNNHFQVVHSSDDIDSLMHKLVYKNTTLFLGHTRLMTNDNHAYQPLVTSNCIALHNGIIVNDDEVI